MTTATSVRKPVKIFGFQEEFCTHGLEEPIEYLILLAHGGRFSGKTMGGAIRTGSYMIQYPGSFGIVTAPTNDLVRDVARKAVFDFFESVGMQPGVHFDYNETKRELSLFNGSKAIFRTTEDPDLLRGLRIQFFWMDEGALSPRDAFVNLVANLTGGKGPRQGWITTTPRGRNHWLYKTFYVDNHEDPEYHYIAYPAKTRDNIFGGGEEHYQQLIKLYGENSPVARQELGGDFVMLEGLVYPMWDVEKFIISEDKWPTTKPNIVVGGIDFGWTNPFAILIEGMDKLGRRYIIDEYYKSHCSDSEMAQICNIFSRKYNVMAYVCDTEDPAAIHRLRMHGVTNAIPARKKIVGSMLNPGSGIGLCATALSRIISLPAETELIAQIRDESIVKQGFFVSPKCRHFKKEIESYIMVENKDSKNESERPRDKDDHIMSCWRYAETYLKRLMPYEAMEQVRQRNMYYPTSFVGN